MDLSIIYVNWNSLDYLYESIASVYRHTRHIAFEIVVVDNASTETGIESLSQQFPKVVLIKSDKNLGFAGANNLGFKHSSGEFVLLLNPDTKLIGPSINIMMEHIRSLPDAGVVGCKLLNTNGSVQLSSIQRFPTILNQAIDAEFLRLRWPHCRLWKIAPLFANDVKVMNVDVIPGACMLLRRRVFQDVGLYSEDYFMYAEDLDLNFKLKRAGFKNYYVGEAAIIHHGGGSSSRQKVSHWATIMKYRAMLLLFRKNRGWVYGYSYRMAIGMVATGRMLLLLLMVPMDKLFWKQDTLRFSLTKWKAVWMWAVGLQGLALQDR
jgi:N-acetylglucosaminyl-diphospho-decaprenol L-rhamnosyltransferase